MREVDSTVVEGEEGMGQGQELQKVLGVQEVRVVQRVLRIQGNPSVRGIQEGQGFRDNL